MPCLAFAAGLAPAAAQEELRIGLIAPMTGPFAQVGADMTNGFKMYLDEVDSNFAGAKVNLIIEDSQGKPDTAVTKAKKLILEDHVQLLVGGVLAPEGYALAPVSTAEKTVYIASVPAADDLTQRQLGNYPYFIRTSWTSSQPHHPLGQWACDQGYKKIITVGADYAFGYEAVGGFQKAFEDCGGKIIQKIWPPLGTKDFGPYIPTFKADADAVFSLMVGPMPLQFPKQLRASGWTKPIIGGGTSYDESVLPFMGDEVIGDVSALQYSAGLQTPKNEAFVKSLPRQIRQGAVVFLREQLHHGDDDRLGDERDQGRMARPGSLHREDAGAQGRRAARAGQLRRHAQSGPEHLHQEGREDEDVRLRQGRAVERGDQDLSGRQPVLDLRQGRVPQAAGL